MKLPARESRRIQAEQVASTLPVPAQNLMLSPEEFVPLPEEAKEEGFHPAAAPASGTDGNG